MTNCNAVCRCPEGPSWTARGKPVKLAVLHAPVAQLDRVLPSEGRGRTFESSRACQWHTKRGTSFEVPFLFMRWRWLASHRSPFMVVLAPDKTISSTSNCAGSAWLPEDIPGVVKHSNDLDMLIVSAIEHPMTLHLQPPGARPDIIVRRSQRQNCQKTLNFPIQVSLGFSPRRR